MAVFPFVEEELLFDGCFGLEPTVSQSLRLKAFGTWGEITLAEG
jgi:hypothetical protein